MKKKVFAVIIDNERLSLFSENIKFFLKDIKRYAPNGVETYLIDISNLHFINKPKIEAGVENLGIKCFSPKNFKELYNFSKKNKILGMIKIRENFSNLRLNILLNIVCSKRIIIATEGLFISTAKAKSFSFFEKVNFFINVKLSYYFYRILSILGVVKNVDLLITASQVNIDSIKSGISSRIESILPINLAYIKKIHRVNSNADVNLTKKELPEKFIVLCDSGFDHGDRILRDGIIEGHKRDRYYQKVYDLLNYLELTFGKKVIFCEHPKADYPYSANYEKIRNSFEIKKYETEKYIDQSYLTIFLSSLMLGYAMTLKKKIILIKSLLLGNFYHLRHLNLINEVDLFEINIDSEDYKMLDKNKLNNELSDKIKNYDKFIEKNLIKNSTENHTNQIQKIIYQEFLENPKNEFKI